MIDDLRLAFRSLRKNPTFAAAALIILALGLGANGVVFGVVDTLLLRPLPFGDRGTRLVTLHSTHPTQARDWDDSGISFADLLDLRTQAGSLEAVEGLFGRNVSLAASEGAERVLAASVTPGLFGLLGVRPQLGRGFAAAEAAEPGFESVALISDALWHRRFGQDPSVVGSVVRVNGRALEVVGVMPPGFRFPERHDLWLPYAGRPGEGRQNRFLLAVGLLRPGVEIGAARAEVSAVAADLAARYPDTNRQWGMHLLPLRDFFVQRPVRLAAAVMLGAVGFVLLVVCANVAALFLARSAARGRELTVRAALGAGRLRLARLLLAESLVLAVAGGLLGLLLASWGFDALLAARLEPPPYWQRFEVDLRLAGFVSLLSLATALACGLAPALRSSRIDLAAALSSAGRNAALAPGQQRLQSALVVGQVAVSLALLVGATLLTQSVWRLQHADPGFDPSPLLTLRVYLAGDVYDPPEAKARAAERAAAMMRAVPGALASAATSSIPTDDGGATVRIVDDRRRAAAGEETGAQLVATSPELWTTLGLPMLEGRTFTRAENLDPDADVVVVNRRLAATFWPGESALGRRVGVLDPRGTRWHRVVGVVPDVVYEELNEQTAQSALNLFVPLARSGGRNLAFLVRADGDPGRLAGSMRPLFRELDPELAPYDMMTMPERWAMTQWDERFIGQTFLAFALAGLLLVCTGAYGVMAYSVAQRTREIGVRLALGATRGTILRHVLGRGAGLLAAGLAIGLPAALATARGLESLLFDVSPWNPAVLTLIPLALALAVLLACYLPARRASRTDPAVAMREA